MTKVIHGFVSISDQHLQKSKSENWLDLLDNPIASSFDKELKSKSSSDTLRSLASLGSFNENDFSFQESEKTYDKNELCYNLKLLKEIVDAFYEFDFKKNYHKDIVSFLSYIIKLISVKTLSPYDQYIINSLIDNVNTSLDDFIQKSESSDFIQNFESDDLKSYFEEKIIVKLKNTIDDYII